MLCTRNSHSLLVRVQYHMYHGQVWLQLTVLDMYLPENQEIPLLGLYSWEMKANIHIDLYLSIHSIFIYISPKLEAAQMFIHWWMDKQLMVYTMASYTAVLKNKLWIQATQGMNLKSIILSAKANKRLHTVWFHFCENLEMQITVRIEIKSVAARSGVREREWLQRKAMGIFYNLMVAEVTWLSMFVKPQKWTPKMGAFTTCKFTSINLTLKFKKRFFKSVSLAPPNGFSSCVFFFRNWVHLPTWILTLLAVL